MIHLLRPLPVAWRDSMPPAQHAISPRVLPHLSMCEVSTGRGAIAHLLERMALTPTDGVLVPAYVAEGVLRPLLQRGVRVVFYRLLANLDPDQEDVVRLLQMDPAPRLLILVHPLGWEAEASDARAAAAARGCAVLDDCAQGLLTSDSRGGSLGALGDFALFSLNKFAPVPDGAILTSRRADVDVGLAPGAVESVSAAVVEPYLEHLSLNARLLAARDQEDAAQLLATSGAAYDRYYVQINDGVRPLAPSEESREIRERWDVRDAAVRRRRNAERLLASLHEGVLTPIRCDVPAGVAPFAVSMLAPQGRRDEVLARAWARGVLLSTLVARWNFVPVDSGDRFQVEQAYMDRHMLIPVSEFLDDDAMDRVIATLNAIGQELS